MVPSAFVYILTNQYRTVLYVGMTNDLRTRIWEHKTKQNPKCFTAKYNTTILVYFEAFDSIIEAIKREAYLKRKTRKFKDHLITAVNPGWHEMSDSDGFL